MGFSDDCVNFFGTEDLYEILGISRQSSANQVRKAYYKLSLSVHPDRVASEQKGDATEKFKVLGRIWKIMSDPERRTIYDETGSCSEEEKFDDYDWTQYWRNLFGPITEEDIMNYEKDYIGSEVQKEDVKKAYLKCKGDMDKMFEYIPFLSVENEDQIRAVVQELIENDDEVPEFTLFTQEPQAKRDRRMRKMKKEANEAEAFAKERKSSFEDLQKAILGNKQQRTKSFFESLEEKYANPKMSSKGKARRSKGKL